MDRQVLMLLLIALCATTDALNLGGSTQNVLLDERFKSKPPAEVSGILVGVVGRSQQAKCYNLPPEKEQEIFEDEKENNFLAFMNFIGYVQSTGLTSTPEVVDAIRYFNVSMAALTWPNRVVAQENMARSLAILESIQMRKKRDADDSKPLWDANELFEELRLKAGDENYKEIMHMEKKVTVAFIIDVSDSMSDDMDKVKQYIDLIMNEQVSKNVSATFIVTTFADPKIGRPKSFRTASQVRKYLESWDENILEVGGDCEEKTCYGIIKTMQNRFFQRHKNTIAYVFTDADSKDCSRQSDAIIRQLDKLRVKVNFILFDTCKPNVDHHYVEIARSTGGLCLLIKDTAVYNITDTVNGAFQADAVICGEHSDNSNSVIGQGINYSRKRRSVTEKQTEEKKILIDTTIETFRVVVTIEPKGLLKEVVLKPPMSDSSNCDESNLKITTSMADKSVIFDVSVFECPCTGEWSLRIPGEYTKFLYNVRSRGEYLVDFDAYFVEETLDEQTANIAPCLGKEQYLVIKLYQGEKVEKDSLVVKVIGVAGNVDIWEQSISENEYMRNTFVTKFFLPTTVGTDGVKVLVEGRIVDGSAFRRFYPGHFTPTTSCTRITKVNNYYALFPNKKTFIWIEISNNGEADETYSVLCKNSLNYRISSGAFNISPPRSRYRYDNVIHTDIVILKKGESARVTVAISTPRQVKNGRTNIVTCTTQTSEKEFTDEVNLTEMEKRFD